MLFHAFTWKINAKQYLKLAHFANLKNENASFNKSQA